MKETRERVRALLDDLGMTQVDIVEYMNDNPNVPYRVTPPEFCNALRGALTTPKATRMMGDALAYLERKQRAAERRSGQ